MVRNTLERNACNNVLTPSLGNASMRLATLCVATMGMHFGCRDKERNRSSPVGLSPPTVAKFWYSSQMNTVGRKCFSACVSILGMRSITARLIIDLHHGADGLGQRRVQGYRKIQPHDST